MKNIVMALGALALLSGCAQIRGKIDKVRFGENPYVERPFYARYLNANNPLDRQIEERLTGLRANPRSATLHNELGGLLITKGFSNDAEREFNRAISIDSGFYPAHYNLALVRESKGDLSGAARSLHATVRNKPGHAAAIFHLGLLEEKRGRNDNAVALYAKALHFNRALLDVRVNPRILDTELIERALLLGYPEEHAERSMRLQGTPSDYVQPAAVSNQPKAEEIITPTAPVTEPAAQSPTAPPVAPQ